VKKKCLLRAELKIFVGVLFFYSNVYTLVSPEVKQEYHRFAVLVAKITD
jgi:hypothetical protein